MCVCAVSVLLPGRRGAHGGVHARCGRALVVRRGVRPRAAVRRARVPRALPRAALPALPAAAAARARLPLREDQVS